MEMTLNEAKERAQALRIALHTGGIEYKDGRKELENVLRVMDKYGEEIADKYGVKYKKLNVSAFLR